MRTEIKYRLVLAFGLICLIGFAGQSILLWKAHDRLAYLEPASQPIPTKIEQQILAELDKKAPPITQQTPFTMPGAFTTVNQIQNAMDSIFSGFGSYPFPNTSLFSNGFGQGIHSISAAPEIALDETDSNYQILIPVDPTQEIEVNTSIENNSVSVSGVIKEQLRQSRNSFASSFLSQRQFAKTVKLPRPVDEFGMTTEQTQEGIKITIPKKAS